MQGLAQVLTITIKELREIVSRPWQALTLILGPLALMVGFGIGSEATARPPSAIVVVPAGQAQPRLLRDYQRQFESFLDVTEYTDDEAYARRQLRRDAVDAVVLLPPAPFETIASGRQATIRVLYNQIDPLWRWVVPNFTEVMAGAINREIFLQTLGEQQAGLDTAMQDIDLIVRALDLAIEAADAGDRAEARRQVQEALSHSDDLEERLVPLGPEVNAIRSETEQLRARLAQIDQRLATVDQALATPDARPLQMQLGLGETLRRVQELRATLDRFISVPPEVVISPLAVETQNLARIAPDIIVFFAPSLVALLIQHIAVSMGALAFVRERLAGVFGLYTVAPIANLQLLLGKYLAYLLVTLAITAIVLLVMMQGLHVPLLGSPWRLALMLVLLAVAAVGFGLMLSLLATSERQAVQFAMLSLLGVVFFSGFTLPLAALREPALVVSYLLPATYGISLLQDVMLRGGPGSASFLLALAVIAVGLFLACLGLLHWRTRPR